MGQTSSLELTSIVVCKMLQFCVYLGTVLRKDGMLNVNVALTLIETCSVCREAMLQVDKANRETMVILEEAKTVRLSDLIPNHWL
jgi:cytidine deaminase